MQAVKPVNSAKVKCDRIWKSRGKWIVYTTNFSVGKDNWISKSIVAQAIYEAMHYIHYRDSISKSSNYMCMYIASTNAILVLFKVSCYTGSTVCTYYKMY